MNKHVEEAKKIRNEVPMCNNCAETIMRVYADEIGIDKDVAATIASNFGGGMKCGGTCGAITAALMVLGTKGITSPNALNEFRRTIAANHNGMTDCAKLLAENVKNGGVKKDHCDNMVYEAIELIDEITEK